MKDLFDDTRPVLEAKRQELVQALAKIDALLETMGEPASSSAVDTGIRRKRRPMSVAARKAASARMTAYWAKRRKTHGR